MPTYSRTISRIITDATQLPAWRRAMTQTDRLYYVTADAPSWTEEALNTPLPTHFGESGWRVGFGAGWEVISGYSSGTLLEDVGGPWGTMVYGTGGHTRLQNQLLGCNLSQDKPTWFWWQQPTYKTAAIDGAELYYNPAEQAALIAGPRGSRATVGDTQTAIDNWDKQFPVAFDGWIWPAKMTTGQLGDNAPHSFRYATTCFVPSSVTGGASVYFASLGPLGPFSQSYKPSGMPASNWIVPEALFNNSQERRMPFYFKNCRTGAWTEHKWQPDVVLYGATRLQCNVFKDLKRIYLSGDKAGGTAGWWYIDMSAGFAKLSRSDWIQPSTAVAPNRYGGGAWTEGHPDGRHLVFYPDLLNTAGLVVQDFDHNTQARIDVRQGLNIPVNTERLGMSYDAAGHRLVVLLQNLSTKELYYYSVGIPSNHLDGSAYTVTMKSLALDDSSMSTQLGDTVTFGRKTHVIGSLGVLLVPFGRSRMLGFIPGP